MNKSEPSTQHTFLMKEYILFLIKLGKECSQTQFQEWILQARMGIHQIQNRNTSNQYYLILFYFAQPHPCQRLHYINDNPHINNNYQDVMKSFSEIILDYDLNKRIHLYGFGAQPKYPQFTQKEVSHCFPLSGDIQSPYVHGLQQILEKYRYALQNLKLSGPTLFNPIIKQAIIQNKSIKEDQPLTYSILLLMTDGVICDMDETIQSLFQAVNLPLSIIIVGIGNEDFTPFTRYCEDRLTSYKNSQKLPRENFTILVFKQLKNDPFELAQLALSQVSNQVVEYFKFVGSQPKQFEECNINQIKSDAASSFQQDQISTNNNIKIKKNDSICPNPHIQTPPPQSSANLPPQRQHLSQNPQIQVSPQIFGDPHKPVPFQDQDVHLNKSKIRQTKK